MRWQLSAAAFQYSFAGFSSSLVHQELAVVEQRNGALLFRHTDDELGSVGSGTFPAQLANPIASRFCLECLEPRNNTASSQLHAARVILEEGGGGRVTE